MTKALADLEDKLGHNFARPELLKLALTHASMGGRKPGTNNERLEFLGDRVLGLCVAQMVFTQYPEDSEGTLARRHAGLVSEPTLAAIARRLALGDFIRMSTGEDKSGGRNRDGLLADTMEAVLAAVYLDGGLAPVQAFIAAQWAQEMESVRLKDAKTQLQEWLQGQGAPLPEYEEISAEGQAHDRDFTIRVVAKGFGEAIGSGRSKQVAQQAAADMLLAKLGGEHDDV